MRIGILTTQCPFVIGGAELHARSLERALRDAGHEAEIISMPFKWYPSTTVLDHMLAARCLDVSNFNGVKLDLAIGLKFPAWLMQHPNKTYWIIHQHRQAYDLWDSGQSDLFDDENGQVVREAIRTADNAELGSAPRVFANSANVARRLLHYNSVVAKPLYHPPPLAGRLTGGDFGDYFYYPSRLSGTKRHAFVLRSLALAGRNVRVVFSGASDNPDYGRDLARLADELGVAGQVEWKGFVSEAEMIELYAGARGVLFTPIDEDLGYVALEAMLAAKPVLTLSDAGEPAALVRHEAEGLVAAPDVEAFASAMDRLANSRAEAYAMGAAGRERYEALNISWPEVVATLTDMSQNTAALPRPAAGEAAPPVRTRQPIEAGERLGDIDWVRTPAAGGGPTLEALASRYAFDEHLERHRGYYETHWPRFQATLAALALGGIKPRRILELGTAAPYLFTAFLREAFPEAEFRVVQESPAGLHWRDRIATKDGGGVDLSVHGLNVETTALPFPDDEFDLVVAMEILEHFAIDPSFVLREARRVLCEGGALLMTTPNLVSLPAVDRALSGASPYSFGLFVPWNGVYGRHNREFTPHEVEGLALYAGFETALLDTADVYRQNPAPEALVQYMSDHQHPLDLRGQNIFYLGRKGARAAPAAWPEILFPNDPAIFSGSLQLERIAASKDGFIVRVVNTSPVTWLAHGPTRVRLTVDRIDQDGLVALDVQAFPLPCDMAPGDRIEAPVRAIRNDGVLGVWYEIGLYAEGAGAFKGAGRARTVSLFAEQLEAAPELSRIAM